MKYKAVLFDMDGTVLDTLQDLTDSVNYTLAHFGMPQRSKAEVCSFTGNAALRLIQLSVPEGSSDELVDEVLAFYKPYYNEHCLIKTCPYGGIPELMKELKDKGLKLAVISNKPHQTVCELSNVFFTGLLDISVGDEPSLRKRKPAPDSLFTAARQFGLDISECVYVGDSEVDVLTARNAGMDCIAVSWGFRSRGQLIEAGASLIVDSVAELRQQLL